MLPNEIYSPWLSNKILETTTLHKTEQRSAQCVAQ